MVGDFTMMSRVASLPLPRYVVRDRRFIANVARRNKTAPMLEISKLSEVHNTIVEVFTFHSLKKFVSIYLFCEVMV